VLSSSRTIRSRFDGPLIKEAAEEVVLSSDDAGGRGGNLGSLGISLLSLEGKSGAAGGDDFCSIPSSRVCFLAKKCNLMGRTGHDLSSGFVLKVRSLF
jgi:hypothetical protein